jgi:hypothetical protein
MALTAGIGLLVLGIFNLATIGQQGADCCGHDHDHDGGHDHDHDHKHGDCGHDHSHDKAACCGHDHSHDHHHDHDHAHEKTAACGHDHSHEKAGCCGHEHGHHDHSHDSGHDHAHGIIEESGPIGRTVAICILSVPLVVAAAMSPDAFSPNAVINKGLYSTNYASNNAVPQSRVSSAKPGAKAPAGVPAPAAKPAGTIAETPSAGPRVPGSAAPGTASVAVSTLPPAQVAPAAGSTPPAPATGEVAKNASAGAQTKSYGTFTLEDLKAQVPQSKEGNFILEVPELYYTAGDKEVQGVLAGQQIETTAQVLPEKVNNADGKRLRIFRLLVQCCAADARPYSVPVEFKDKAPTIKDMTWVKLVGKMGYVQENGQTVPIVYASDFKETTAPDNAMLY